MRGSIKSSPSPLQISGSPAPPFSPRPAPHARLAHEAFLPLIRFTELRHPRYRRREPASPMRSFERALERNLRCFLRPAPFPLSPRHYARDEGFLPLVRHADRQIPSRHITSHVSRPVRRRSIAPLVSVALNPLWTIACVRRVRGSALGRSTRVRALWLMVSNQFRTEGNVG